jgi:hypothetical protein
VGTISLPAEFTAQPSKKTDFQEWKAPDSASVRVWVTEQPLGGMAASGGGKVHMESDSTCVLSIAGRHALVYGGRVWMQADTNYFATISVFADTGIVVNGTINSFSAKRRAELISRFSQLSLTKH